jgi:hypothetical protein
MLPLLIDILKDILAAGTNQEVTRMGDVSSAVCVHRNSLRHNRPLMYRRFVQSLALKKKYEEAANILAALAGVDISLEGQQDEIRKAKELLRQKRSDICIKVHNFDIVPINYHVHLLCLEN